MYVQELVMCIEDPVCRNYMLVYDPVYRNCMYQVSALRILCVGIVGECEEEDPVTVQELFVCIEDPAHGMIMRILYL